MGKENIMFRKDYPTDLSEKQQKLIEPLLPPHKSGGRPPMWSLLEIVNAILYVVRSGCAWRLLPHDLPPWQTVYYYSTNGKKREYGKKFTTHYLKRHVSKPVGIQSQVWVS